jgi:phage portal protein BeeE
LKFMFENGNRPQAVIMVPGVLELDMSAKPQASRDSSSATRAQVARAA